MQECLRSGKQMIEEKMEIQRKQIECTKCALIICYERYLVIDLFNVRLQVRMRFKQEKKA